MTTAPLPPDHPLRPPLTHLLGMAMMVVSESTWASSWNVGAEEEIPRTMRARFAAGIVGGNAEHMCAVADALGHWANYAEVGVAEFVPYVPECDREPA